MNQIDTVIRYSLILFICFFANSVIAEPTNLSVIKQQLMHYHDNGEYLNEITQVDTKAQHYLADRIAHNNQLKKPEKLAIVFDIDETLLTAYDDMVALNFGGNAKAYQAYELRASEPAIMPSLELYNYAKSHDVAIFLITGRPEWMREATAKNLTKAGFSGWSHLSLKPNDYHQKSAAPYKTSVRKQIEQQGYTIVASLGDQNSDLTGGYAEKGFKLPNPYYYIP